ncbi:unnamed protein product, partial [Ectocarpus sp. 13 AM-2016]
APTSPKCQEVFKSTTAGPQMRVLWHQVVYWSTCPTVTCLHPDLLTFQTAGAAFGSTTVSIADRSQRASKGACGGTEYLRVLLYVVTRCLFFFRLSLFLCRRMFLLPIFSHQRQLANWNTRIRCPKSSTPPKSTCTHGDACTPRTHALPQVENVLRRRKR